MSEMAKKARADNKEKAHRLAEGDPHAKVDASDWTPPEQLNTEAKTGMRPVSRRQYNTGGVVGATAKAHGGKAARKAGGRAKHAVGGTVASYASEDAKKANPSPHVGGYKTGGRTAKALGGPSAVPTALMNFTPKRGTPLPGSGAQGFASGGGTKEPERCPSCDRRMMPESKKYIGGQYYCGASGCKPSAKSGEDAMTRNKAIAAASRKSGGKADGVVQGTRPTGGREARAEGGRTKKNGKTNINIIISAGGKQQPPMPPPMPPAAAAPPPMPPHPPMMPPGGAMPPGAGGPPPPPPPMPRKDGGRAAARTGDYKNLEAGSNSGLGRLQKAKGKKP